MRKSIGDNVIPKEMGLQAGLELIKNAGFEGVELWLGGRPWFGMTSSDADLHALFAKVRNAGLHVSNVSNTLDWDENIASGDARVREAAFRHIERQMEAAQVFQCDAILIVAGVVTPKLHYDQVYDWSVEGLQRLGQRAAAAHVRIGVENCCAEQKFLLSPREFRTFLRDVNNPAVGIHLDVGNIHDTGFAEQWIEMLGSQITCMHLKDPLVHRGRCGNQSVYTDIFLGDNDWPAIRAALLKANYDGWLVAELEWRYRYARDQQFYDTAAAMRRLIAGTF